MKKTIPLLFLSLAFATFLYAFFKSKQDPGKKPVAEGSSVAADKKEALNLLTPKKEKEDPEIVKKIQLKFTLLLAGNNLIYAYPGNTLDSGHIYSYENIGPEILKRSTEYIPKQMKIVVKPDQDASYSNTIDILDILNMEKIDKYMMVTITDEELEFLKKLKHNN